ncbi:g5926 [Coccomyxa elongata]
MSCLQSSDPSDLTGAHEAQWPPAGWNAHYGKRNRIGSRGYICNTTTCTCGPSELLVTGTPHIMKEFSDDHGDHRPEYRALKRLPDEIYADGLYVEQRVGNPRYRKYQQRVRSLGFFTTAGMLEKHGFCLPEKQQRYYYEHLSQKEQPGPSMQHESSAATASCEEVEDGEEKIFWWQTRGQFQQDFRARCQHWQRWPEGAGSTCGYHCLLWTALIQKANRWAEKHGDCKPQFRALKALEDEQYSLLAGFDTERIGDPRYKKYQQRMRDLGFLSTVPMLEAKGYCLPEEAQAEYDSLYPKRERTRRAVVRRASSTEESAGRLEDTEDMDYNGSEVSHITAEGRRRRPKPVDVAAPRSRKRRSNAPAAGLAMKSETAESAESRGLQNTAAAESTHRMKRPKKSRAVSPARQLQSPVVLAPIKVEPAASRQPQDVLQAAAADSNQVQRRAIVRASAAPAGQLTSPHPALEKEFPGLEQAVQSQIAAGGVRIDIDRVLQCLQAASAQERRAQQLLEPQKPRIHELQGGANAERRDHQALLELQSRVERNEKLLAAKDNEIRALREQVELQKG